LITSELFLKVKEKIRNGRTVSRVLSFPFWEEAVIYLVPLLCRTFSDLPWGKERTVLFCNVRRNPLYLVLHRIGFTCLSSRWRDGTVSSYLTFSHLAPSAALGSRKSGLLSVALSVPLRVLRSARSILSYGARTFLCNAKTTATARFFRSYKKVRLNIIKISERKHIYANLKAKEILSVKFTPIG